MLKSEKAYRTGKIFLILGIVFAVLTVITGGLHCMEYDWMPFELIFPLPFAVLLEYVLIGAGVTLIFFGVAWICYGVGGRRARKEYAAICSADEEAFVEDLVETDDPAARVRVVLDRSSKKPAKKKLSPVVEKFVVPAVVIGVLSLAVVLTVKKSTEQKSSREKDR
ncbi:MAG: hypothetical protein IKJ35_08010 [Clostridia bacterium]|nr:hypothetical protein [Clostridia bacterium]